MAGTDGASNASGLLRTVLPSEVYSLMEFRELATAARESALHMTSAMKEGSGLMRDGMLDAGREVGGSMVRAGVWVGIGMTALAGAWVFSCEWISSRSS